MLYLSKTMSSKQNHIFHVFFVGFGITAKIIFCFILKNNDFEAKTQFFFGFSLFLAPLMREIVVLLKQNNDFEAKTQFFYCFSLILHSPSFKNSIFIA